MSLFNTSPGQRLRQRRQNREQRGRVNEVLEALRGRMSDADQRAGMTVRDLYGDSIDRFTDNVRSSANATKQALARLGGISGDNVTGATGVALNRVDQRANQSIGDAIRMYQDQATGSQERSLARGDSMLNALLGAETGIMNTQLQLQEAERQRQLAQQQANRSLIGDILGVGGQVGAAYLMACWVAEELYGKTSIRTHGLRLTMLHHRHRFTPLGLFEKLYRTIGQRWARAIKPNKPLNQTLRTLTRTLFNYLSAPPTVESRANSPTVESRDSGSTVGYKGKDKR